MVERKREREREGEVSDGVGRGEREAGERRGEGRQVRRGRPTSGDKRAREHERVSAVGQASEQASAKAGDVKIGKWGYFCTTRKLN